MNYCHIFIAHHIGIALDYTFMCYLLNSIPKTVAVQHLHNQIAMQTLETGYISHMHTWDDGCSNNGSNVQIANPLQRLSVWLEKNHLKCTVKCPSGWENIAFNRNERICIEIERTLMKLWSMAIANSVMFLQFCHTINSWLLLQRWKW